MSRTARRKATLLLVPTLAVALAACGGSGASVTPPGTPPSATPNADVIDHPTGATDVVLRYEESGGFVMPAFAATLVPHFTLYGDGTVIFRDPMKEIPPTVGDIVRANPMRIAHLVEAQVQDLLRLALGEGGLAVARPEYRDVMVADATTALFTVRAGGIAKTVAVYALGLDVEGGRDAPARAAFAKLAQTLTSIEGSVSASDYVPTAYRGVLLDGAGLAGPSAIAWPWDDIEPADFALAADQDGPPFPHRRLTPAEVEELGVAGVEGGLQNVTLLRSDGSTYAFALRPLLPDESE